jgi:hypothetical protein
MQSQRYSQAQELGELGKGFELLRFQRAAALRWRPELRRETVIGAPKQTNIRY